MSTSYKNDIMDLPLFNKNLPEDIYKRKKKLYL